jgi:hypothetical protein
MDEEARASSRVNPVIEMKASLTSTNLPSSGRVMVMA